MQHVPLLYGPGLLYCMYGNKRETSFMATESDARLKISIDAPLVPFGQFQIRIREPGQKPEVTGARRGRKEAAPYSLPSSTGDGHRLVFSQGASR